MQQVDQQPKKRPVFLLVLAILSLVYMGFGVLFESFTMAAGKPSQEEVAQANREIDKTIASLEAQKLSDWEPTFVKMKRMGQAMNRQFYLVHLVNILIYGIGIFAVIKMMTGFRIGFHLYIVYSLLSSSSTYFFVSPADIPTLLIGFSLVLSTFFIGLYAINLKWMR